MNANTSSIRRRMLVAMLAVLAAGCAGDRTRESTGEYIDDSAITTKVKALLFEDRYLKAFRINVNTFKGEVQFGGFADSARSAQ